jgi:hypothetical protein
VTRLVLHVGAEFADAGTVVRDLVANRAVLEAAGVTMPVRDDVGSWRRAAHGLLHGEAPAMAIVARAKDRAAEVALFSSDTIGDALASPAEAARLATLGTELGLAIRVVVVVREQIGYINSLYCHRVLALDSARSFAEFTRAAVPAHRFDFVASFGAIADTPGIELVAISYPELVSRGTAAVVAAAGVDPARLDVSFPGLRDRDLLPGPVLVAAARLLHKRLRRLNAFDEQGREVLRRHAAALAEHARVAGWDDSVYWGWDGPMRRAAIEEYEASNAAFAEFVWKAPWPEPWSSGPQVRTDLADLDPAVLHDLLTTVDRLVEQAVPQE